MSDIWKTNPLLVPSDLNHNATTFGRISNEHFMPAFTAAIVQAKENVEAICKNTEPPNFTNTIEALEISSQASDHVASVFFNLLGAHTNPEMQTMAAEVGPQLSELSNDILLNKELFTRIETVFKAKPEGLDLEQQKLLEDTYQDFVRNGANLDDKEKKKLRKIDSEKAQIAPKYSDNVLSATNEFQMLITDKAQLAGLPESAIEAADIAAANKNQKGWLFTLDAPSFLAFMKYSEISELREKLYRAYTSRAFDDANDNKENVLRIVKLREERAQLLGAKTHAHFVLAKRMAETPERVMSFLDKLFEKTYPAAQKDLAEVQDYADKLGGPKPLQPWDFSYYSEKLKQEKYSLDEEILRPYFSLDKVVQGAFEHARRLYGLEFKAVSNIETYHEDVQTFEVRDAKDEFVGLFYADFFPRESKRGGAWMTAFKGQGFDGQKVQRPHIAIVCNFTKPTKAKPSLLTFNEVQTLFHEFGHALHGLLSKCHYQSLSGTNVYWDFVELPSQLMENWTLEKESLDLFAAHFKTGEKISAELCEKIKSSHTYLAGYSGLRQLSLGYLDMSWHSAKADDIKDVAAFEENAMKKCQLLPVVDGANMSCAFSHIFAGGYSAGYYSYKWAEVLDADAFEYFKEKGLFNKDVATRFKENILTRGGTEHPMELYKRFRGREPDPDALLRRDGLI